MKSEHKCEPLQLTSQLLNVVSRSNFTSFIYKAFATDFKPSFYVKQFLSYNTQKNS